MSDYSKLQNGNDIRGVALEGVDGEKVDLTQTAVRELSMAFAVWLKAKLGIDRPRAAVGSDSRLSADELRSAALDGLASQGVDALDAGMASTPAMFMSCVLPDCDMDGSIMITASHLPWNRNGMKFFTKDGGLEHSEVGEIVKIASDITESGSRGSVALIDVMTPYCGRLRNMMIEGANAGEKPLSGLKIAVDAGNGAGGFFATRVLEPLGADISASRYLEPDGRFPNHIPNPENKTAQEAAREMTLGGKCDLGIIFDADVDRAGAISKSGDELCRNRLIAAMAAICKKTHPGCTIVTDSVTSDQLKDFIEDKLGLVHHRFKRGYKNVIDEAKRLALIEIDAPLAIETSGHAALSENYYLDDGAYLSAKLIVELVDLARDGRTLDDLTLELGEPLEALELRPRILTDDFRAYGEEVLRELDEYADGISEFVKAENNYEGLRYSVPKYRGWFLLRLSLHEPLMPLNIESSVEGGASAIFEMIKPFINSREGLSKL